jgi:Novel STAND NTPase 1
MAALKVKSFLANRRLFCVHAFGSIPSRKKIAPSSSSPIRAYMTLSFVFSSPGLEPHRHRNVSCRTATSQCQQLITKLLGHCIIRSELPAVPGLHIYRNLPTPVAPLEPREQREGPFRQWDPVQEFCAPWEKEAGAGFRECCHDFQDLEEFESLFREHFRDFLARRLDPGIASGKASPRVSYFGSNPFRGLDFFDCEHSALYHGRTRAVGEVLDILKQQAAAKKRFLLVLGPSGSGKSSFVQAGVLPLVTRGGTSAGAGPWRRALTRPGAAQDPFNSLAAALFAKSALPELHQVASPEDPSDLASRLRKDPDGVAAQIGTLMDQLAGKQLGHLLENRKAEGLPAKENESIETSRPTSLAQREPIAQLALVVDQLEELFTMFSPVLQKKYMAALCALANCERVFIIATLRSDFYPHYQRFSELTAFGGRYDLQPPTPRGIRNIIRFRTEAAGLHFEQDSETSRCLDETILKAAVANPAPLPLLEHLLSRLYQRQHERKDGLLLWSDYQAVGGFQDALAQHAEFVFLNLKGDEQQALKFVIRNLLVSRRGEDGFLNRRSIKYRDLILSPQLNERQKAGTRGLIDRFIKEGLLSAETDPQQELLISIPQEAMLHKWRRVWELVSEERHFLRMRDRLDANVKLWISGDRQREDLLDRGIGLAEAQILLTDFEGQLNEIQIDYIRKSLARHKPRRKLPQKIGLAAISGLAIFAAFVGGERFNAESRRTNKEQDVQLSQQNVGLSASQRSELEAERGTLEIRLKETEHKLQIAQQNADLANSRRTTLEAELKKTQEEKAQLAQQNADLAASQQTEQVAEHGLETQLQDTQDKLQLAQKKADLANAQRAASEAELKKAREESAQRAQQNSNLADAQSSEQKARLSLETQLKDAKDKLQLAQENANLANTQRSALDNQLKDEQVKLEQAQAEADHANSQLRAIQGQLKREPEREQNRQANTDSSTSEIRGVSPDALIRSKTEVVFEEKQDNLPRGKDALLTPPQHASPLPSPAKESEALNSPKPQSDQSALTDDKALVKQFVLGYIKSVASDDTSLQRPYFGEQVNYYREGVIGSPKIAASLKRYPTQWPVRNWEPRGEAKVARLKDPNLFAVFQPFNWAVSDGSNQSHGNATLYARVRKTSQGKFQIEYLRELTADRSGRRHRKRK